MRRIVPIVEGQGDVASIPIILRRIAATQGLYPTVARPIRIPRNRLVRAGEFERAIELAARQCAGEDVIVTVIDADDDAPCRLGPGLLERARGARSDLRCSVVLAKAEMESWFLGALESLRGVRGVAVDATAPADPEGVRDAKGYLSRYMPGRYSEITDQPAFAATFDLGAATARCPSFDKLCRDVGHLLGASP